MTKSNKSNEVPQEGAEEEGESELIPVTEAMHLLGTSTKTMTRLITDGAIPVVKRDPLDRRIKLVRKADVERLLHETKRRPRKTAA